MALLGSIPSVLLASRLLAKLVARLSVHAGTKRSTLIVDRIRGSYRNFFSNADIRPLTMQAQDMCELESCKIKMVCKAACANLFYFFNFL